MDHVPPRCFAPDLSRAVRRAPLWAPNDRKHDTMGMPSARMAQIRRDIVLGERHSRRAEIFALPDAFMRDLLTYFWPFVDNASGFANHDTLDVTWRYGRDSCGHSDPVLYLMPELVC